MPETEASPSLFTFKAALVRESKNMVRYEPPEAIKDEVAGAIYIAKESLPTPFPTEIEVTIR
jgi:hypothetical protein